MIQRIQTLYLLISSVIISFLFYSAIATFDNNLYQLFSYGIKSNIPSVNPANTNPVIIFILAFIVFILGLVTIFMYKNRKVQTKLCIANIIILLILTGTIIYYCSTISVTLNTQVTYRITAIFPFISLILTYISMKSIQKDEKLVRSVDRIR
jgi:hypothetical protein